MKIKNSYIDLAGFLEGSANCPLHWQAVGLNSDLSAEEWQAIEYFQLRAREFLLNVEDLKLPSLWSLMVDHGEVRASVRSNTYPGRHRVKSLYLDFRHFIADKEPSKFQRIINILVNHLDKTHPIQAFLSQLKQEFLQSIDLGISLNGRSLPVAQLLNLWFNTEFFHAGRKKQIDERHECLRVLHEEAVHQLLAWGVVRSAHTVKSLYACVKDLHRSGLIVVNCPDSRLIFRNARSQEGLERS